MILGRHQDLENPSSHPIFHNLPGYAPCGKQCRQVMKCGTKQWMLRIEHSHHACSRYVYFRLLLVLVTAGKREIKSKPCSRVTWLSPAAALGRHPVQVKGMAVWHGVCKPCMTAQGKWGTGARTSAGPWFFPLLWSPSGFARWLSPCYTTDPSAGTPSVPTPPSASLGKGALVMSLDSSNAPVPQGRQLITRLCCAAPHGTEEPRGAEMFP